MKYQFIIIILLLITGCSAGEESSTRTEEIKTRCIDGVVYYLSREAERYIGYGYMSPKYKQDGSVVICN